MNSSYLLAFDFDGTIARTFESSPSGIGVKEAYDLAVKDIFGNEGEQIYIKMGGLQNRAPTELVRDMLSTGNRDSLVAYADRYVETHGDLLGALVEEEKGLDINDRSLSPQRRLGEILVRAKLSYLLDQIGTEFDDGSVWPRPCRGFMEFWSGLKEISTNRTADIATAVISSGHDEFINRTFDVWGISHPDILVTEDNVRGMKYPPVESDRVFKPGQLQLAVAHRNWLKGLDSSWNLQGDGYKANLDFVRDTRQRMIYFGDDPRKDGGMAERASIPFGHFDPGCDTITVGGHTISFSDWMQVDDLLRESAGEMGEGVSFFEILEARAGLKEREINYINKERE